MTNAIDELILRLPTSEQFRELTISIHQGNVDAGWWSDLKTGESILATRNRSEVMMLIVSEYCEAYEGLLGNKWDDHLPNRKMFDVELADAAIRIFDLVGAERIDDRHFKPYWINETVAAVFPHIGDRVTGLFLCVTLVNTAFEHYRKGHHDDYMRSLAAAVIATFALAVNLGIPLAEIIEEKRAYNAKRLDHKRESRLADGGKAI